MKRSRIQFEANGHASSDSPQGAYLHMATDEDSKQQILRHIPKISRRIRACTNCKNHKVRCDKEGEAPCQRCHRMGLDCVVNKSLQTLLDDETE